MEEERKEVPMMENEKEAGKEKEADKEKEEMQKNANDADIVSAFTDLPMGLLISQPFLEVAKGQAALCEVYLETLARLAYEGSDKKTRVLSFEYTKPVVDASSGSIQSQTYTVNAPLLSLVPVPAFTMEEATVSFSMDVNVATTDTSSHQEEAAWNVSTGFWGVKASVSGKVSSNSSKSRQESSSAKYDIYVRATQKEPAEGMAKLTSLLASTIEPIETTK